MVKEALDQQQDYVDSMRKVPPTLTGELARHSRPPRGQAGFVLADY